VPLAALFFEQCRELALELRQAFLQAAHSRLEVALVQQSARVRVEESVQAEFSLRDDLAKLFDFVRSVVSLRTGEPPSELVFNSLWFGEKRGHVRPHGVIEQVDSHLPVFTDAHSSEAIFVSAETSIVGILSSLSAVLVL
jgi:hypothetical protein